MAIQYAINPEPKNTYEGCVVSVCVKSYQIMSDVWGDARWATVWDEETQSVSQICVCVLDYDNKSTATVDATPDVLQKVKNWKIQVRYNEYIRASTEEAKRPKKNSRVRVVSGRNGKGSEGVVVVEMTKPYNMGYSSKLERKFGIALSDEKIEVAASNGKVYENYKDMIWVWARNVELIEVPEIDTEYFMNLAKKEYA